MRWVVVVALVVGAACLPQDALVRDQQSRITALEGRNSEWEQLAVRVEQRIASDKQKIATLTNENAQLLAVAQRLDRENQELRAKVATFDSVRASCASIVEENESLRILAAKRCGSDL